MLSSSGHGDHHLEALSRYLSGKYQEQITGGLTGLLKETHNLFMRERLQLFLFGSFRAEVAGRPITRFESDKARALLVYVVVEAGGPQRRESLATLFWPDLGPKAARHNLSQVLFSIKQAFEEAGEKRSVLLADRHQVQLNPEVWVGSDVRDFEALLDSCQRHGHERPSLCAYCMEHRQQAVALYRGEFLQGLSVVASAAYDDWVTLGRERWQRQAVESLFILAQYHEWRGELSTASEYARRQVALEPWREEAHRQLMRLLAHGGQRSAALAQYEICRQILEDELGVEPAAETEALYAHIRDVEDKSGHNLPAQPIPFIGRQAELAYIAQQLAHPDGRVLTIVGTGGVGKTRLALQVGEKIKGHFLDGVWYVPLAGLETAELLLPALAETLNFAFSDNTNRQQQLLRYLRQKEMLLILDSFEHLPQAASLVGQIAQQAEGIKFLITSRERLNLSWAWSVELDGLDLPLKAQAEAVTASSAGQLLLHHIRRGQHDFVPTTADLLAIRQICSLVEGLPLALELAGAWARMLSCLEIAGEIEQSLSFLSTSAVDVPVRHRSVRAVIDHSWRLLTPEEQIVFSQLAIFRGRFRREAAQAVVGASLPLLTALVDKSLVKRAASDYYELHELMRQFAREKLAGSAKSEHETGQNHAIYFAEQLDGCARRLPDTSPDIVFGELEEQFDNLRAAWQWAVARQQGVIVRQMVDGLFWFCDWRGRYADGRDLWQAAVNQFCPSGQPDSVWTAGLLVQYGRFCTHLSEYDTAGSTFAAAMPLLRAGDDLAGLALVLDFWGKLEQQRSKYNQARSLLEQSITAYRQLHDLAGLARALNHLGAVVHRLGEYELARRYSSESLHLFRRLGHRRGLAVTLHSLAYVAYELGEYGTAEQYYSDSIIIRQEMNDRWGLASAYNNLGIVYYDMGDHARAKQYYQQSMNIRRELGDIRGIAVTLNNLGLIAVEHGNYQLAEKQYHNSLELCQQIGNQQGISIALNNLGEVATLQEAYEQAYRYHQQSLAIAREIGYRRGITFALEYLGRLSLYLSHPGEARRYYREALQLAWESQAMPRVLQSLFGLALLAQETGEVDLARKLLQIVANHEAAEQATRAEASQRLTELPGDLWVQAEGIAENSLADLVDSLLEEG
jgi:predicted ATPase/DNA-binding SARP family transcriptional activator/Tfp pilus assembly protein PilF